MNYFSIFHNGRKSNVYHQAAKQSDFEKLKHASEYELNERDDNGRTVTHWAALKGNVQALIIILSRGGNPEKCDYYGNSSLHYAVRSGSLTCVSYLVNFDPDLIWILDNNYKTAQQIAMLHNYTHIYKFLDIVHGIHMRLPDNYANKLFCKALIKARKRRKKYDDLMEKTLKTMQNEYNYSSNCANNFMKKLGKHLFDKGMCISTLSGKNTNIKAQIRFESSSSIDFTLFNSSSKSHIQY